jgi:hypothetical protein
MRKNMGRKTTWKSSFVTDHDVLLHLDSIAKNHAPWKKYTIDIGLGIGNIDTNLPWSELRVLFQSAGFPFPKNWAVSNESLEELYGNEH